MMGTRHCRWRRSAEHPCSQFQRCTHVTSLVVLEAARGVQDHQLAYYDAQVWATARLNQIPVIFSEDFTSGTTLEGVRFVDPFAADFAIETWV